MATLVLINGKYVTVDDVFNRCVVIVDATRFTCGHCGANTIPARASDCDCGAEFRYIVCGFTYPEGKEFTRSIVEPVFAWLLFAGFGSGSLLQGNHELEQG